MSPVNVTLKDEEYMMNRIRKIVKKNQLGMIAILLLETIKPIAYYGGEMGRFFLTPFLPIFGEGIYENSDKFITTFEKRDNLEKLIRFIENDMKKKK